MNTKATASSGIQIDWKRIMFLMIGVVLFGVVYLSPPWPDAVDPMGKAFALSPQGKAAIALFLLAGTWWVLEVVPIGVTGLTIGVVQALFFIRPAADAFKDFMDPSVLFIFGSLIIGTVFTKVGITRRLAYKMLMIVGERTSMIYLGCFVVTALLTHVMAHTAVAATMYPLLLSIYALYTDEEGPTRFGKGLFMGMAFVAGAGSIVTLLGAARGIVALGFYEEITNKTVTFFEITYYMFPVGWIMVFVLWGFFMVFFKPEKAVIPGLREKARQLSEEMGPFTRHEVIATAIILGVILFLSLQSFIPALKPFNKAAVLLVSTILFFIVGILDIQDLEDVPWNIILLFAGAMSMGFCLWQTGASHSAAPVCQRQNPMLMAPANNRIMFQGTSSRSRISRIPTMKNKMVDTSRTAALLNGFNAGIKDCRDRNRITPRMMAVAKELAESSPVASAARAVIRETQAAVIAYV
ncbi:MAG: SLC13 family permease, partial [Desulfotignum sp.]